MTTLNIRPSPSFLSLTQKHAHSNMNSALCYKSLKIFLLTKEIQILFHIQILLISNKLTHSHLLIQMFKAPNIRQSWLCFNYLLWQSSNNNDQEDICHWWFYGKDNGGNYPSQICKFLAIWCIDEKYINHVKWFPSFENNQCLIITMAYKNAAYYKQIYQCYF